MDNEISFENTASFRKLVKTINYRNQLFLKILLNWPRVNWVKLYKYIEN